MDAVTYAMPQDHEEKFKRGETARQLRAEGWTWKAIASHLGVSGASVRYLARLGPEQQLRVRCGACDAEVNPAGAVPRFDRQVYCLRCLGKRPEAPFHHWLRTHRLAAGLTLAELARRADVSTSALWQCESGVNEPSGETLAKLARVLPALQQFSARSGR